jgi:hypothetical protein
MVLTYSDFLIKIRDPQICLGFLASILTFTPESTAFQVS